MLISTAHRQPSIDHSFLTHLECHRLHIKACKWMKNQQQRLTAMWTTLVFLFFFPLAFKIQTSRGNKPETPFWQEECVCLRLVKSQRPHGGAAGGGDFALHRRLHCSTDAACLCTGSCAICKEMCVFKVWVTHRSGLTYILLCDHTQDVRRTECTIKVSTCIQQGALKNMLERRWQKGSTVWSSTCICPGFQWSFNKGAPCLNTELYTAYVQVL